MIDFKEFVDRFWELGAFGLNVVMRDLIRGEKQASHSHTDNKPLSLRVDLTRLYRFLSFLLLLLLLLVLYRPVPEGGRHLRPLPAGEAGQQPRDRDGGRTVRA